MSGCLLIGLGDCQAALKAADSLGEDEEVRLLGEVLHVLQ